MALHPDVEAVLATRAGPPLTSLSVAEARAAHAAGAAARPPGPDMKRVINTGIAGVAVRSYQPSDPSGATVVFFHGGGWVLGSVETHDQQCRLLADGSGAAVISVDYRLAPEHPFPAAYEDALAVTTAVMAGAADSDLGTTVDRERVGVAGDSAGGNLAAATALACRELDVPNLRAQLLIYPAVDAGMTAASFDENRDAPFLTRDGMAWFYDHYRGDHDQDHYRSDHDLTDWRLSPLNAPDLARLPAALVITAELDPLRDEGEAYAQALAGAGVRASAVRYAGVSHGFFGWSHVAEPSRQAMAQAAHWLRAELSPLPGR